MLPQKINDLTDGFVRVYDLEHAISIELRKAHNRAATSIQQSGVGYRIDGLILYIGKNLTAFLETTAQYLWEKLKPIVTSTKIEHYPELNIDLKSKIANYYNPARQAAKNYLEQIRQSSKVPTGHTVETKATFNNIRLKINAEVDLFCEGYAAKEKEENQTGATIDQNYEFQEKVPSTFEEGLFSGIWKSRFRWVIIGMVMLAIVAFAVYTAQPDEVKIRILKCLGFYSSH